MARRRGGKVGRSGAARSARDRHGTGARTARARQAWGTAALLAAGALITIGVALLSEARKDPELCTATALGLLSAGVYGVWAGVVGLVRARGELPYSFGIWAGVAAYGVLGAFVGGWQGPGYGGTPAVVLTWAVVTGLGFAWAWWELRA